MPRLAQPKNRPMAILVFTVAASAAWACGETCSQAASIATRSDCDAAPRICDRCATANINGGDSPSGIRCWPLARWTAPKQERS